MKTFTITTHAIKRLLFYAARSGVVLIAMVSQAVLASPDELQLAVDESVIPQLRWDSLTGKDEWLAGPRPEKQEGQYRVVLQPGESLSVLQAAKSWLRLLSLKPLNWAQTIQVEQSGDGKLFVSQSLKPGELQQHALLQPLNQSYIARLQNNSSQAITLSLYRSRYFRASPEVIYSDVKSLQLETVDLQITPTTGLQRYYRLAAMASTRLRIKGPQRLAINMRRPLNNQTVPASESHLSIYLDKQLHQSLENYFEEDYSHSIRLNGRRVAVSRASTIFMDIAEGEHELMLQSGSNLYLQVRALNQLYWSDLNLPAATRWLNDPLLVTAKSDESVPAPSLPLSAIEQRLLQQSRDNSQPDGALAALAEIDQLLINTPGLSWSAQQSLVQLRQKIKQRYTHFQPVLPVSLKASSAVYQHRWLAYTKDRLQYRRREQTYYLAQQFFKARVQQSGRQGFHLLDDRQIEYSITPVGYPAELQLLIYQAEKLPAQELWIQFDEQPAQAIQLRDYSAAQLKTQVSVIQTALAAQGCCTSVLGKLAADRGSAARVSVASVQLPLSAATRRVKIWQKDTQKPLWLALQQRRGSTYKLSQAQFIYQMQQTNAFNRFTRALAAWAVDADKPQKMGQNLNPGSLENHWLPLLKQLAATYHKRLENIQPLQFNSQSKMSADDAKTIQAHALLAEQSQQWLLALERWSQLWTQTAGEAQQIALQHMVMNMQRTGQHALAKQLQLAIIFSRPGSNNAASLVESQLELLLKNYRQQGKSEARVALLSAFFVHQPNVYNLQRLALIMVEEGRWQQGLELLLLLPELQPEPQRELEAVLLSALQVSWLDVFDQQLLEAGLPITQVNKWQGLKALFNQDYATARLYFSAANSEADKQVQLWVSTLEESEQLQRRLLSADVSVRQSALKQWQALQLRIISQLSTGWRVEHASVMSHGGQVILRQPSTQVSLMHYLSRPQQPLELQIAGPARLKLQIRPLHQMPQGRAEVINSSYHVGHVVKEGEQPLNFPINHNLASKSWRLDRKLIDEKGVLQSVVPGQRLNQELILGAGVHRLRIAGEGDLLIRLQTQYNPVPASVLPQLTAQTMAVILDKTVAEDNKVKPVSLITAVTDEWLSTGIEPDASVALQQLQLLALQLQNKSANTAQLISQVISQAEKIYASSHRAAELTATMSRIRRYSRWDLLNSVEHSDGVWVQRFNHWKAESPKSRLYQALLPAYKEADELLRNGASQIVSVFNPQESQLEIQLQAISPLFIRTRQVQISYQLNNNKQRIQSVSPKGERIRIRVPQGRHSIKISLLQAPLHHRLLITLKEQNGQSVSLKKSRRYQLASQAQPLIYRLQGPAWLRIDKYFMNHTESTYRYVSADEQRLTLRVDEKEQSAYFRVFQRRENQAILTAQLINWEDDMQPEILPQYEQTADLNLAQTKPYKLKDDWNLGRQQSGTTSLLLTRVDQNLIIDELAISTDKYLESELAYRQYQPVSEDWFYVAGIARYRQQGRASMGVKSWLRGQFATIPIDWTVDGRAYAQQLESGTESSALLQLRLSQTRMLGNQFYHLPRLDVFARWLSAESDTGNTNVDRDVYSDYKRDHPSGLRLSETLVYRPYQDMELYTGLLLVSNSRWQELDQYQSRLGARVQWGDVRWDINARQFEFLADKNRPQNRSRSVFQARVLLEKWLNPRYRFELAAALDHDIDSGDDTLRLQLSVHQSEGRGYSDYSPAETLFRNVRQTKLKPGLDNEFN